MRTEMKDVKYIDFIRHGDKWMNADTDALVEVKALYGDGWSIAGAASFVLNYKSNVPSEQIASMLPSVRKVMPRFTYLRIYVTSGSITKVERFDPTGKWVETDYFYIEEDHDILKMFYHK